MDLKQKEDNIISVNLNNGSDVLKKFVTSVKENPNEIDYFHILESITNQKMDKEIIKQIFLDSINDFILGNNNYFEKLKTLSK